MKVTLGTLKDKGDELAAFLEPRVGSKPSVSGDSMEFEDESVREGVKPRQVKTYIKRFLFMNGVRKKYRVFVAGKELTIQEIVTGEEAEEEKEKAPAKKPEAEAEEPAEQEEPEEEEEAARAPEPKKAKEQGEKPKKAAPKKPRASKKKADGSS
ncbi:MAG: hypothetical protein JRM74_03940 [Nitrososphaerota archaeon]|nr:hypothetical protein [Nitrososphaerota archaeon]MDG6959681.1 hypothetical protein [Nitrososphaerota archaeon]MDG6965226.1 hypothetical protein [Nitrososphaerota archaeon]MDG6968119.1 hypothetical protein [Nitrososphaerota archaeon]MDG6968955.1 hypothetical protein [Nitrososphaerota archaeon]